METGTITALSAMLNIAFISAVVALAYLVGGIVNETERGRE